MLALDDARVDRVATAPSVPAVRPLSAMPSDSPRVGDPVDVQIPGSRLRGQVVESRFEREMEFFDNGAADVWSAFDTDDGGAITVPWRQLTPVYKDLHRFVVRVPPETANSPASPAVVAGVAADTAEREATARTIARTQLLPIVPSPIAWGQCETATSTLANVTATDVLASVQAIKTAMTKRESQVMAVLSYTNNASTLNAHDMVFTYGYGGGATDTATTCGCWATPGGATSNFGTRRISDLSWNVTTDGNTNFYVTTVGSSGGAGGFAYGQTGPGWSFCGDGPSPNRDPNERFREMVRDRMAPNVIRGNRVLDTNIRPGLAPTDDFRELRARETLASVVGEEKFRRFVRDGFITARGASGRTYQIFPGSRFTRVYNKGQEEKQMCVVLNGKFPPTDSLIVRFLMILNDEEGFRKLAIPHSQGRHPDRVSHDERPLAEIYRELHRDHRGHDKYRKATESRRSLLAVG